MSAWQTLPETKRCYVLGPGGTFSEQAAVVYSQALASAGRETPEFEYTSSIEDAVALASREVDSVAIVPIENSETGTVVITQEELRSAPVSIEWELAIPVRYNLIGTAALERIQRVYCHPVAHGQCTHFLRKRLPDIEIAFSTSNAQAGTDLARLDEGVAAAAIVPSHFDAGELEHVSELAHDIQNSAVNTTRFVIVRARSPEWQPNYASKKTSLVVVPQQDRPGLLAALLAPFGRHGLNITRIESRPSRDRPWAYIFFLDFQNNAQAREAIDELRATGDHIIVLGTYDELVALG